MSARLTDIGVCRPGASAQLVCDRIRLVKYTTLYGHMSRFASARVGQHVSQGQVIGYVGMTGLASGPHLHYEFRVGGTHRDPLKVTLPKEEPLPASELAVFRKNSSTLLARLHTIEAIHLAQRN